MKVRTNADEVAEYLRDLASKVEEVAEEEMRIISREAVEDLRMMTPVDTGHLRSSWKAVDAPGGSRIVNESRYAGYQMTSETVRDSVLKRRADRPPFTDTLTDEVP